MNIAINGFGRIGRAVFKILLEKKSFFHDLNVVVINDMAETSALAHLLKYDTCYGVCPFSVGSDEKHLIFNKKKYLVVKEKDPANLPWKKLKIDLVIEATGLFLTYSLAQKHLEAGAKKVILTAPSKDETINYKLKTANGANKVIPTIVFGVNQHILKKTDTIISAASCTTNCLTPVTEVVRKTLGIKKAIMTTVHSYTADQNLVDGFHKDLRRARSASLNIVPTTTGAAKTVAKVMPELENNFDGLSLRVPTPVVSLCDIVFLVKQKTTKEELQTIFKKAANEKLLKGILTTSNEPLVSSDYIGNSASAIVDLPLIQVVGGDLIKVVVWYDNEWGYSNRVVDICKLIIK